MQYAILSVARGARYADIDSILFGDGKQMRESGVIDQTNSSHPGETNTRHDGCAWVWWQARWLRLTRLLYVMKKLRTRMDAEPMLFSGISGSAAALPGTERR